MQPVAETAKRPAKLKKSDVHSSEVKMEQTPPVIAMPGLDQPLPTVENTIEAVESPLNTDYLEALRFAEDPIAIIVTPPVQQFGPPYQECTVNGKGIEVLVNNVWLEFKAVPFGKRIVTKRKYVEVLARSIRIDVTTDVIKHEHTEENNIIRTIARHAQFSVLWDPDTKKGPEWLTRLLALRNSGV